VIGFVIISEQVQEAVERKDTQLGCFGVPGTAGLPPGHSPGNHNLSEQIGRMAGATSRFLRRLGRWKAQNVGRVVAATVLAIQGLGQAIADQRDVNCA
jgi:hypothetical protein